MPAMRVLLIEDEAKMAALIRRVLTAERHVVDVAPDGVTGAALAERGPYDVIVLDRMLPDVDGVSSSACCARSASSRRSCMLTALGAVERPRRRARCWRRRLPAQAIRVRGADRPDPRARSAVGGRCPRSGCGRGISSLDELRHVAQVGDRTVDLSAREFALLGYLIRHAGQVMTRQQILDAVWGAEPDVYSNVVDLYVHYLRRKLGELGRAERLRTVRGVGYTLRAEA